MDNIDTKVCTCTTAYFRPDDNQWEPPHQCEHCRQVDEYLMNEMEETIPEQVYYPPSCPDPEDDLPF